MTEKEEQSKDNKRRISQTPPPITPVEMAGGWISPKPKPTHLLEELPPFYPNDLKVDTYAILSSAVVRFPMQSEILSYCRCVLADLTPSYVSAVRSLGLSADLAIDFMADLLRYILIYNCKYDEDRCQLSQELRRSGQWATFLDSVQAAKANFGDKPSEINWDEIGITFLSDERVQIERKGTPKETLNYWEFGFRDRRSDKPNQAWITLRTLAEHSGVLSKAQNVKHWKQVEKAVQRIRKALQKYFQLSIDPIPFVTNSGYKARFKITCAKSYQS